MDRASRQHLYLDATGPSPPPNNTTNARIHRMDTVDRMASLSWPPMAGASNSDRTFRISNNLCYRLMLPAPDIAFICSITPLSSGIPSFSRPQNRWTQARGCIRRAAIDRAAVSDSFERTMVRPSVGTAGTGPMTTAVRHSVATTVPSHAALIL
jgi:hypothetical protein